MIESEVSEEDKEYIYTVISQAYFTEENEYYVENAKINLEENYGSLPNSIPYSPMDGERDSFVTELYTEILQGTSLEIVQKVNIFLQVKKFKILQIISGLLLFFIFGVGIVLAILHLLSNSIITIASYGICVSLVLYLLYSLIEPVFNIIILNAISLVDVPYLLYHRGFKFEYDNSIVDDITNMINFNRSIIEKISKKILQNSENRNLTIYESFSLYLLCSIFTETKYQPKDVSKYYQICISTLRTLFFYNQNSDYLKYYLGYYYMKDGQNNEAISFFKKVNQKSDFYYKALANIEFLFFINDYTLSKK